MTAGQTMPPTTSAIQLLSSDSHVFEPRELWAERIGRAFGDAAPHVVRDEEGNDWWWMAGRKVLSTGAATQAGVRMQRPDLLRSTGSYEQVRPGAYDPQARLDDAASDGIAGEVLYPTVGLNVYRNIPDSRLLTAVCAAYNDWLAEFCSGRTDRLKGVAMLNVDDVAESVRELERARRLGLVGAMISVDPLPGHSLDGPEYEPLWAVAEESATPLSLHVGTNRSRPQEWESIDFSQASLANRDYWVRMALARIIYSGVFERHPRLFVGSVEHELAWAPHFLERMDYSYRQRSWREEWHPRFKSDALPSEFFRRNVFCSFQEDALGIQLREAIGLNTLTWGSDYPHQESTFPHSREVTARMLTDVPTSEQAAILYDNCARLYGWPARGE